MASKVCGGACGEDKPLSVFANKGKKPDGTVIRGTICNVCNNAAAREKRASSKTERPVDIVEEPRACSAEECEKGDALQPATAFEKSDIGRRKVCKACRKGKRKAAEQRDDVATKRARAVPPDRCSNPDCDVDGGRPFSEAAFEFRTDSVHGAWRPQCRRCEERGADGLTRTQRYRGRVVSTEFDLLCVQSPCNSEVQGAW